MHRIGCAVIVFLVSFSPVQADPDEAKAVNIVLAKKGEFSPSISNRPDPSQPITNIRFVNSSWDDKDMKVLAAFKDLKWLTLHSTQVTDAGLKELAGLKHLEVVGIVSDKISGKGFEALGGCEQLRSVYLGSKGVTDAGLAGLAALKGMRQLELSGTTVTGEGLGTLSGLESLEKLEVSGCPRFTAAGQRKLTTFKNLRVLLLGTNTPWTDAGLQGLSHLKQLESLYLSGDGVTDALLLEIRGLARLRTLRVWGTRIEGKGFKELAALADLREAWLDCPLKDDGVKELATVKQLHSLKISCWELTDAGVRELAALTNLKELKLDSIKKTIDRKPSITEPTVEQLRKALPKCKVEVAPPR